MCPKWFGQVQSRFDPIEGQGVTLLQLENFAKIRVFLVFEAPFGYLSVFKSFMSLLFLLLSTQNWQASLKQILNMHFDVFKSHRVNLNAIPSISAFSTGPQKDSHDIKMYKTGTSSLFSNFNKSRCALLVIKVLHQKDIWTNIMEEFMGKFTRCYV